MLAIGFVIFQGTRYQAPAQQTEAQADSTPASTPEPTYHGPALLAGSFCFSMPTDDASTTAGNFGSKTDAEYRITFMTFTQEEKRRLVNHDASAEDWKKVEAIDFAGKHGYVPFTIKGVVDRYFATSPLNIVNK